MAWAPPTLNTCSIPALRAATRTAGSALAWRVGAVHMIRAGHPAMAAGTASMMAVEGSGAEPAGTYRPTARIGTLIRSHCTPGAVFDAQRRRHLRRVKAMYGRYRALDGGILLRTQRSFCLGELLRRDLQPREAHAVKLFGQRQ